MSEVTERAREYVNKKHPAWHDNGVGIVQGSHYRSGFVDGAKWQASQPATDAQVEAAWAAYLPVVDDQSERAAVRAAVEAALAKQNSE